MDSTQFSYEMEEAFLRSKKLLMIKEKEYSAGRDRLDQFHRAAHAQGTNPAQALLGMMTKHYTSIADMCKEPEAYDVFKWREKLTDLRNYTFLLEALIKDLGVE